MCVCVCVCVFHPSHPLSPSPISALDDATQEHIWMHLIEGLLADATVIVASSRAVISCSAVVYLTRDGLVGEPKVVDG